MGKEIEVLKKQLPENHVNLFATLNEEVFNQRLEELKQEVPKMEDWQIVLAIAELLVQTGDSHTKIWHQETMKEPLVFPVMFKSFKDGIYVVGATTSGNYDKFLGYRLKSINGIVTDSLIQLADRVLVPDNSSIVKYRFVPALSNYYVLHHCGVIDQRETIFELESQDSKQHFISLQAIPMRSFKATLTKMKSEKAIYTERDNRVFFWQD